MKENFHVIYSFDNNYAQQAGLSILSLLDNNKDIDNLKITIIDCGINETNKNIINSIAANYHRGINYLLLNRLTDGIHIKTKFNEAAFGRIFIPNIINDNLVYYIDSDTIINGSIYELKYIDMKNFLVAGVQDSVNPYYISTIGLEQSHRYINSGGILILNLSLWRKLGIVEKCINFIDKYDGNPPHYDQGTINKVCSGMIKILPPQYNVMPPMFVFKADQIQELFKIKTYYNHKDILEAINKPIVIHYTAEFFNRPWYSNCTHPLKGLYLKYLNRTEWRQESLPYGKISNNCRIQNFIHKYMPYCVYKLMIRYIEYKHIHSFK